MRYDLDVFGFEALDMTALADAIHASASDRYNQASSDGYRPTANDAQPSDWRELSFGDKR